MAVGKQHFVKSFKAQTAAQDLALRAFAAIQEKAVVAMEDDVSDEEGRVARARPARLKWRRKRADRPAQHLVRSGARLHKMYSAAVA